MDRQAILNGSYFSLDEKSGMKFRLVYRNWNDYGYYTLYALELSIPHVDTPYRIADIRVMNIGQKKVISHLGYLPRPSFSSQMLRVQKLFFYFLRLNKEVIWKRRCCLGMTLCI